MWLRSFRPRVRSLYSNTDWGRSPIVTNQRLISDAVSKRLVRHPHLQRGEGMFGRLATLAHGLRVLIEALLYFLQHMLMLPACDSSLLASGATLFDGTALTGVGPVAA